MDALIYGNMVNIAYSMFENNITDITNPIISSLWPTGWTPVNFIRLQKTDTTPKYITQNELFGFLAVNYSTNTAAIILRGTQTSMDWVIDLGVVPEQDHDLGGTVEGGFNESFKALVTDTNIPLSMLINDLPQANIVVSGHSLGSSLATLAAASLAAAGKTNVTVYLFASPRTGNAEFVTNFNAKVQKCISYINSNDIVPKVPPFYDHVGNVTTVDSNNFPLIKQSIICWHTLLDYLYMLDQNQFSPPASCNAQLPMPIA